MTVLKAIGNHKFAMNNKKEYFNWGTVPHVRDEYINDNNVMYPIGNKSGGGYYYGKDGKFIYNHTNIIAVPEGYKLEKDGTNTYWQIEKI